MAKSNDEKGTFGYFEDYAGKLAKNIDVRNCFAVSKGMCFFVNAGVLSPIKYGTSNFVVPYDMIEELIKEKVLLEMDKKEQETANIVNKV